MIREMHTWNLVGESSNKTKKKNTAAAAAVKRVTKSPRQEGE
jgi:hypothetical protein